MKYSLAASLFLLAKMTFADPAPMPQRAPDFIPLGVYWPGECTFNDYQVPKLRWAKIDAALDGLASNHVNAIWLTHLDSATTAEFARRAEKRGIYLVASLAELAGENEGVRKSDHQNLIANTLAAWGDAPKPIAWGLGDEPRGAYMDEMKTYADAWRKYAPGEPVTTAVMWNDVAAAAPVKFDALCSDVYPFFSAGNPNGYGMPPAIAWMDITRNVVNTGAKPWMMGQGYQEPWGPFELSDQGNIVYLPGGAPHWVMPTPAEIKWQAWAALASGGKGMFYFLYRWPLTANPKADAARLPAAVKERTDSGSPRALVYDDGRPTPQFLAMGDAFRQIRELAPMIAPLKLTAAPEAWPETELAAGNIANVFIHPKTGARYLFVVAGFYGAGQTNVPVILGPHIIGLKNVRTGAAVTITVAAPFRHAQIELPAGEGALFECQVDADNLPTAYSDDFTTDKYKTDAVNGATPTVMRYPNSSGTWLAAAQGNAGADTAFLIYDLDKLLGAASAGAVRILLYNGSANPPWSRGAFWSASDDAQKFTDLSANQFDQSIIVTQRYLKVGLSWNGSTAPHYGHVSRLSFFQWKRPAIAP